MALGGIGLIPGLGEFANAASLDLALGNGDWATAGWAAEALVPGAGEVGDVANEARLGTKLFEESEVASNTSRLTSLPNEASVVRGGLNTPEQFDAGSKVTTDGNGNLQNVSVNNALGKSVEELSQGIPHGQVGVTTVGEIRQAGGDVIPSPTIYNPNHATMGGINSETASQLFTPTKRNPAR